MHDVVPQLYGAQSCVCTAGHAPAALQFAVSVAPPSAQTPDLQLTDAPGYAHVATVSPSHAPPHPVPSFAPAVRVPTGAPTVGEHVPSFETTLHAAHCSAQAVSQQYPSTQKPDAHWPLPVQLSPVARFVTHAPSTQ